MRGRCCRLLSGWTALLTAALTALGGAARAASPPAEMPPWKEPAWQQPARDEVQLAWKLAPGDKIAYREWQRASVGGAAAKPVVAEGLGTIVLGVDKVSPEQVAEVSVAATMHRFTVDGKDSARLLPTWARLRMARNGRMEEVLGMLGERSLPTFPKQPVKVGGTWTAPVEFAVSLGVPAAVARGEAEYTLTGLAEVDGRRWAKIAFTAELKLARRPADLQRQIGVKRDAAAAEGEGVAVRETVAESAARQAGVERGDRIVALDGLPVRSFGDLLFAVAAAPAERKTPLVVIRGGNRKELSIVVPAGRPGSISAEGSVKGTLVFDATAGRLIRRELTPLAMQVTTSSGDEPVAQVTTGHAILQLVPAP